MREIRTSGLTSGEGKRGDCNWLKPPRPSSTLLNRAVKFSALDCTPGMRHDNCGDRLILRMTCGSKRKEPSVSDGVQIEGDQACRGGRRRSACGPQAWDTSQDPA